MKRHITTVLFISLVSAIAFAQTPEKLLNEVATKMAAFDNMYIKFNYILENKEVDLKQEANGVVHTHGDKYHLNFLGNLFIYDGFNTYIILPEDEEINIESGSAEETMLNPSKLLFFYKEGFTYEWYSSSSNTHKYIKLIPIDSDTDTDHYIVGIDKKTNIIYSIEETGNNGTVTKFLIEEFKSNQDISKNLFIFDEAKYQELNYTINR